VLQSVATRERKLAEVDLKFTQQEIQLVRRVLQCVLQWCCSGVAACVTVCCVVCCVVCCNVLQLAALCVAVCVAECCNLRVEIGGCRKLKQQEIQLVRRVCCSMCCSVCCGVLHLARGNWRM